MILLMLAIGICRADAACAQWSVPAPGTQDSIRRAHESETWQAGGRGWYHYARIGALRCNPREAIVGADFSADDGLSGIRLHCATVSCAGASCAWDSVSVHDGPSVGTTVAHGGTDCPPGTVVAGYGAEIIDDAPGSVVLDCARLAGAPINDDRRQLYPIVWPGSAGTAIPPPLGGIRKGSVSAGTAFRDTLAGTAQAYVSVVARSNYYAAMDDILQNAPGTMDIRFFAAASQVTNSTHVGAVEGLGYFLHQGEARDVLLSVNERLFAGNMQVLRKLLMAGGPYGNPAADPPPLPPSIVRSFHGRCLTYAATAISAGIVESGAIQALSLYCGNALPAPMAPDKSCRPSYPAMQFDLAMVDYEQATVQQVLDATPKQTLSLAAQDIDRDINLNGDWVRPGGSFVLGVFGQLDTTPFLWARALLHTRSLTFLSLEERVAIGKALIFQLHNCTVTDYFFYMNNAGRR